MSSSDLMELGLMKECNSFTVEQEPTGETYKVYCKRPTREFGGQCSRHSEEAELVRQAKLERRNIVLQQKKRLEEEVLPKATERVLEILDSEESKDADVIKVWQTTMDRIGLAAVQGLVVEGEIRVDAPLDILRRMLTPASEMDDIEDAEIVEESTDAHLSIADAHLSIADAH